MPAELLTKVSQMDIPLLGTIPADNDVATFEYSGKPLVTMDASSPVYQAAAGMLDRIL
jgi:septum formation inhibitor-activating ATPase MinD